MSVNLKSKLLALPLLACSAWAFADGPVTLDAQVLDRITAGTQPAIERIAEMLTALPHIPASPYGSDLLAVLGTDRLALLTRLASGEVITFHLVAPGELVATRQLPTGEQLVLVRQISAADASAFQAQNPGDAVSTYLLNPGESLRVQQVSKGGTNYLYIDSTRNSSVTAIQRTSL